MSRSKSKKNIKWLKYLKQQLKEGLRMDKKKIIQKMIIKNEDDVNIDTNKYHVSDRWNFD